ncbi:2-amino-4-hydroxy-6-hydroxymethyldihydropteridine diphosphokinase [candidate division WOR-1 bacterium RIFOXYC2_FULL_37_10]|uniref:2-amino-4-hydroxy-6-hydroxymethyldihydropteridine diphosphokinase n=1 Tax=candidate division WOR-1 bacterium RIFOXYB2_FULL_37_13 TaxID=1802579 RepID=A0A1F4SHD8_UNCSA|nr:MAG: 2-amino-4-hydroxy-6-hydroxymethyldihydropteridine diphosphokinase [candidate division WOR-1 bacterium RIFOXYA2_FULL_37_7]OGC19845.1 MAG: 2-amino-4-hydroxy-6-hydroxymethyldihydropteridine diphosphokinase [candidate division WOR-1 bacterium RIFOXYB2_FULL_37_13]OGC32938.1 MAG: 2-amino-4-hydroxy-6-hydroxymethyldihydropteridine diphosphokinase [candidate division WOR-1 bacterium RIFOXYC2_FULL_37_10]
MSKKVKKIKKAVKIPKEKNTKTVQNKKSSKVSKGSQIVYLGLGSNVGDKEEYIEQAVFLIGKIKGVDILRRSSNYETEPEGGVDQPFFINAVIEIKTAFSPHKLLEELQTIENALGREREVEWGPRTIDIDILLYGNNVISDDTLQIPHQLMHERLFVLQPLKELSPRLVHPILEKTIISLYDERKAELGTDKYDDELPGFKEIKKGGYDDFERW